MTAVPHEEEDQQRLRGLLRLHGLFRLGGLCRFSRLFRFGGLCRFSRLFRFGGGFGGGFGLGAGLFGLLAGLERVVVGLQLCLAGLEGVRQMQTARADVCARAALHAVGEVELLHHLDVALFLVHIHVDGLQIHRAGVDALAAADADGIFDGAVLVLREGQQRGGALAARDVQVVLGKAHHRAAHDDLPRRFGEAARLLEHPLHRRADADEDVLRRGDGRAGHGDDALDGRQALVRGAVDAVGGERVEHGAADLRGQPAGRHLAAGDRLDQGFLSALRVLALERDDLDAHVLRAVEVQHVHREFFVQLDAEIRLVHLAGPHDELDALQQLPRVLDHRAVVGGDVRLALGAVDDDGVDLAPAARDLERGRERRAAHADDAGLADDARDQLGIGQRLLGRGGDGIRRGVLEVVFDDDGRDHIAEVVEPRLDRGDAAGHGRVHGRGDGGLCLADFLSEPHLVADGDERRTGRADVLGHGNDHLRRLRNGGDPSFVGGGLLIVRMHAAMGLKKHEHHLCLEFSGAKPRRKLYGSIC